MPTINVKNISALSTAKVLAFGDLRLQAKANILNSSTVLTVKNLFYNNSVQLWPTDVNGDLIVLSDYFTQEDIVESDTLREQFEAGNVEVSIGAYPGTPITAWGDLASAAPIGSVSVSGGTLTGISSTVNVDQVPDDDTPDKQTISAAWSTTIAKATGAKYMSIISYVDKPIEVAYVNTPATPDYVNTIPAPASTYSGADIMEPIEIGPLHVGSKDGIQIKSSAAPTVGKDFVTVISVV
jgi:hypothetical protein